MTEMDKAEFEAACQIALISDLDVCNPLAITIGEHDEQRIKIGMS